MTLLLRRFADVVVMALALVCLVIGGADVAAAHFGGGREPSSYRGEITSVSPALDGVTFRLTDAADRIEVRSTSRTPVIVYGYQHKEPGDRDPYLKASVDGVWVNTESQAAYLNASRMGGDVPARLADDRGEGAPVWKKVSDTGVYRWHDHRIHWMLPEPPAAVSDDPGTEHHVIRDWHIYATQGDRPESTITGQLYWVPASPAPWWLATAGFGLAGVVAGVAGRRSALTNGSRGAGDAPLVVAACVLGAAAIGQAALTPLPEDAYQGSLGFVLASAAVPALAVAGLCALGVAALRRGSAAARYLIGGAGALAALQGTSDLPAITRSQLEHTGPEWLVRLIVACVVGLGLGLLIGMVARSVRRTPQETRDVRSVDIASDEELAEITSGLAVRGTRRAPPRRAAPEQQV
ncbi:hypothetical protein [Cumulibacter manganitolerans]|uniref:hypothetical protein n=1 Tax=Cumulibacter manganitolerans TaxID=1884992 RepID=UPI001296CE13|nr:hypothetical protein [Cumulibacter manganitolerans]